MKKIIILLTGICLFCSCNKEDKVPYVGILEGEVKYTGASSMKVDNVIITLRNVDDNTENSSKRIENTGKYRFELPQGKYALNLDGNLCYSKNLPDTVEVNTGKTARKDINIEQLPSTMVILYNDIEYKSGDTITLGSAAALDIWNKHSNKDLQWNISAYTQLPPLWITFKTTEGTVTGGGRKSIVFSIDNSKMANYGINCSTIILTTDDNGSFTVTVKAFKEDNRPGKAVITGDSVNDCPAKSVILTANSTGAITYKWFKGSTLQSGANASTYEVKHSDVYYAVGVNAEGDEGIKSDAKSVTIINCPDPPGRASISASPYAATNDCTTTGQTVTLTANADRAASYIWYRGTEQLAETKDKLLVNMEGTYTYYAKGVNISGAGQESAGKNVTVNSCVPGNPTNLSVSMFGNSFEVSFSGADLATGYKIQCCNTPDCDDIVYTKIENYAWHSYYFNESMSFCDKNYFRVTAVNDFGESSGVSASRDRAVSLSDPSLYVYSDGTVSWVSARVSGITATIYYDLYRKIGNGSWEIIEQHTTNSSYRDSYYSDDEYIYFKVRAYISACEQIRESYSDVDYY
jgi:hypothetical protein